MPEPALNGLAWALLLACVASTAWLSYRSLPGSLKRTLDQAVEVSLSAVKVAEEVRGAWAEEKRRLEGILSADEDVLEQVEKKRARVTSENRRASQRVELPEGGGGSSRKDELRSRVYGAG